MLLDIAIIVFLMVAAILLIEPGDEGITLSRLAPIGKARIKGINVEAKSQDELIDENTPIVVIRVDSYNVIVRPKEETNIHA